MIYLAAVTLHIDEDTSHDERENFRDALLAMEGVMAAAYHDEKPHLMLLEYNPDIIHSIGFVHAEMAGYRSGVTGRR
ncbi:MAG: ATP-binding protein [Gammaproteobacteria bacterium]|nr:ATP-binding protein [Gammaproteobacteria bacterium]